MRSCARHEDCAAADKKAMRHGKLLGASHSNNKPHPWKIRPKKVSQ